jgi:hypothetical protein
MCAAEAGARSLLQTGGVRKIATESYREEMRDPKAPGSTTYPEAKAERDNSMSPKREMPEGVYGIVPRDPRDTVKAKLPETQSPAMQTCISRQQRLSRGTPGIRRRCRSRRNYPAGEAVGNDPTQGDGWDTYLALTRLASRNCGIAYGARALRRRSLRSSPGTGKPSTWRREAGVLDASGKGSARDARS